MRKFISKLWHQADIVEYGPKGLVKHLIFGEIDRPRLDLSKSLHLLETRQSPKSLFKVDLYPYFHNFSYLPLTSFDFWRHSLILGASGSGKSNRQFILHSRL